MRGEKIMFFTPPNLSDEAAYEFVEFFQAFVLVIENHYMHQLRRHTKVLDEEHELNNEQKKLGDDFPF
jgi:hypothetical protein